MVLESAAHGAPPMLAHRYRRHAKRGVRARGKCWNCCMDRGDPRHKVDASGRCLAAPRDGSQALCFECWEQGHRKESCPSKKCFLCLQPGHVWKKCQFKNKTCPKCNKLYKSEHHMRVCLKKQWEERERREKASVIPSNLARGKPPRRSFDPRYMQHEYYRPSP